MFRFRVLLLIVLWAAAAAPAFTQGQSAGREALPAGARLRLSGGLQTGAFVQSAVMSPDGKLVAIATNNGNCALIELATSKELRQISTAALTGGFPSALAFRPDSKALALGGPRGLVIVAVDTGKVLHRFALDGPIRFYRAVGISFSADGRVVAMGADQPGGGQKQRVHAWEVATGKALGPFDVLQNDSVSTALSGTGKVLVTWGRHFRRTPNDQDAGQYLQLWDVTTGKELRRIATGRPYVNVAAAAFTPDGKTLATASGTATYHLFDVATGKERRRFAGRRGQPSFLHVSPDGATLACGGLDSGLQAWDIASGRRLELPAAPSARLLDIAFPSQGKLLALGVQGQALVWWDALSGKVANAPEGHSMPVLALGFSSDGKTLTSASADGAVLRWDAATGRRRGELSLLDEAMQRAYSPGNPTRYNALTLSPDGRYAATNSTYQSNSVRLWDLVAGQVVCDLESSRPANHHGLAFAANGDRLVTAGDQGSVSLWDVRSGQEAGSFSTTPRNGASIGTAPRAAIAPDGRRAVVGCNGINRMTGQQQTRWVVLDTNTGKELYSVPGYLPYQGGGAAFSPDGQLLALTGTGRTVTVVHAATGKEWRLLGNASDAAAPMPGTVYAGNAMSSAVAFAPDGRTLAVAYMGQPIYGPSGLVRAAQSSIEVWELAGTGRRATFKGHHAMVHCLAFSPDGRTLASGGADAAVVLWDLTGQAGAKAAAPTDKQLDEAWTALAGAEAVAAYQAMCRFHAAPSAAVAFMRQRLRPATAGASESTIRDLVNDLNSESFAARDRSMRTLRRLGPIAESALRTALRSAPSLELRRRIEGLLANLETGSLSPEELRTARAVEVLERLGTPEARALLDALAQGAVGAQLTRDSLRALKRLH